MATPSTTAAESAHSKSWTGNVWIQDQWTEQDKSKARDRLVASSSSRPLLQQGDNLDLALKQQKQQQRAFHEFRRNASTNWNVFYEQNKTNFFKDRHYLHKAFPKEFGWLYAHSKNNDADDNVGADAGAGADDDDNNADASESVIDCGPEYKSDVSIVEIGCGVGNAILPLLEQHTELVKQYNKNKESVEPSAACKNSNIDEQQNPPPPKLHIHCLDFAPTAIELLKKDPRFLSAANEGRATGHVYDLSSMHPSTICIDNPDGSHESHTPRMLEGSADVAILLFCLSAVGPHPSPSLNRAARHAIDMLKPGGTLVIRDYGRLDEAQMKLSTSDKELGDNFYRKGDGTGVYYFELDDLKDLFVNKDTDDDKLELLELDYIQRVYRNRGDDTTRRRVWVQGRFRKPASQATETGRTGDEKRVASSSINESTDALKHFLDTSVKRWDDHYRNLSPASSLQSNILQLFPIDFQPWQPPKRKGKRKPEPQPTTVQHKIPLSEMTVIDLGCGVGNTALLNLLEMQQLRHEEEQLQLQNQQEKCDDFASPAPSKPPALNVHFLDASNEAMQKLQCDSRYKLAVAINADTANELKSTAATVTSQVYDLASPQTETTDHLHQSADIALLLFTLSAIGPYQLQSNQTHFSGVVNAVQNAARMLKPGGMILFRDYARYDDDQLQLNSIVGAKLCDNFYIRGLDGTGDEDHGKINSATKGTGCYFFDLEEVRELFTNAGLEVLQLEYITRIHKKSGKHGRDCSKNGGAIERRRVWVNGRFRKRED